MISGFACILPSPTLQEGPQTGGFRTFFLYIYEIR